MAERLSQMFPQSKALVVGNPFTERPGQSPEIYAFETASLRGLEEGFGSPDRIRLVHPELRPEFLRHPEGVFVDPKTTTPLSYLVAEHAFDRLAQANPGFDVLVTLIGMPVNVRQTDLWANEEKIHWALLLPDWRILGGRETVRDAITSEKISVAVLRRPGAPREDERVMANDYRAEFDRRFILVTKDNIAQLLRTYPQLF
jgi:hypothetical protein